MTQQYIQDMLPLPPVVDEGDYRKVMDSATAVVPRYRNYRPDDPIDTSIRKAIWDVAWEVYTDHVNSGRA